jgi:hypothetical protein
MFNPFDSFLRNRLIIKYEFPSILALIFVTGIHVNSIAEKFEGLSPSNYGKSKLTKTTAN